MKLVAGQPCGALNKAGNQPAELSRAQPSSAELSQADWTSTMDLHSHFSNPALGIHSEPMSSIITCIRDTNLHCFGAFGLYQTGDNQKTLKCIVRCFHFFVYIHGLYIIHSLLRAIVLTGHLAERESEMPRKTGLLYIYWFLFPFGMSLTSVGME
ncbi:hypothetical protein VTK56DRAFT_7784 [Thermocarpiscus australiensis]